MGVALEEFLQLLAAALGHGARVPPSAWNAGGGRDKGNGLACRGRDAALGWASSLS